MIKLLFWGGIVAVAYFYFSKPNSLNQGKKNDVLDDDDYTDYEELD
jgi:hypothetical protein